MYRKLQFKLIKHIHVLNFHSTRNNLNKYSDTVLLPKTKFPQKLVGKKLNEQKKHVFEKGGFADLYSWQKSNLPGPGFILHDGPPYANGLPHMGHAINKVLKDIINRYNVLRGKSVHYVPGWDCHGLPIELKAMSKAKKNDRTPLYIRTTARHFAAKTIEEQSKTFKSWGVMGDWNNPYLTYSVPYVKNQLKQFYKLYNKKLIYRDVKPVYWSPSSRTALAEAELEYNEKHKSTAVIVRFKISQIPASLKNHLDSSSSVYALVWTTTPWTLPSNQAICYNPQLSYSFVQKSNDSQVYLVATDLVESLSKELQTELNVICNIQGNELEGVQYLYPFKSNVELPFLAGQHATATKGTGLVHTAPAHGPDDFVLALNYKIPVKCIVNEAGCYTEETELFKGLSVLKEGNIAVIEYLKDNILSIQDYIHSYPYDWRTKKPVIIRASQQWFIDTNAIKDRAIELLQDVNIFPEKSSSVYKNSLVTQLRKRPYWCISRQRVWGVPIPVFYNKHTKTPIISESLIEHLCNLLEKNGTDVWWTLPINELFPVHLLSEHNLTLDDIEQGQDILDIWFDSGVSWSSVLGDDKVADVYLEGVDQFTGWFQSSLMTSVALRDKVPYKTIYVHGFAVDENGHKMSKSLGNVVDPQEIVNGGKKQPALGIDTLRWWVACHASHNSIAFISSNVLQASADEVQKIRNTLRFAVGALTDYAISEELPSLKIIDKYLLHLIYEFDTQVSEMYNDYQFNRMCINVINFVTNPVSALYYSVIKDRLYCEAVNDPQRRSAQYVLNTILNTVSKAIAPIVPHLVEELYMYRTFKEHETFFKSKPSCVRKEYYQPELARTMETVLDIKRDLNKQVTNTLEADLDLEVSSDVLKNLEIFGKNKQSDLAEILQVSNVYLRENHELSAGTFSLTINKTKNALCPRCRKFTTFNQGQLCIRCTNVIESTNKVAVSI